MIVETIKFLLKKEKKAEEKKKNQNVMLYFLVSLFLCVYIYERY